MRSQQMSALPRADLRGNTFYNIAMQGIWTHELYAVFPLRFFELVYGNKLFCPLCLKWQTSLVWPQ